MSAFEEQKLCDVKGVNTDKPTDVYHIYPGRTLYPGREGELDCREH